MIAVAVRNIKIFFKDKTAVFFSLLSVFIIIGLYVLFLGDMVRMGMEDLKDSRFMMDSWIMAGTVAVSSITTTMGAFGIMVDDKRKKIIKDFSASPLSRGSLVGGYIISSYVVGIIMTLLTFVFAEIYILSYGGELLPAIQMLKLFGVVLISVLSSSAMVFFIVSFFNSQNAFATASTILGTMIGFITGVYMPIGILPSAVQAVIKIFPVSHSAVLLRQIMMQNPMQEAFNGVPAEMLMDFNKQMGVYFYYGDEPVSWVTSLLVLLASTALFYGLSIINISRKRK